MLEKGQVLGARYQIEGVLGEGGMATVYRALHTGTRKACAIKVLKKHVLERAPLAEMFVREAQVGAVLGDHPHIIDIFDASIDEALGVPYLAMPLLNGETLEQRIQTRGPLPPGDVAAMMHQLSEALEAAHGHNIVHRDLKPSNLFLASNHRGQLQLKVLDFGIAKVVEASAARTATDIGTPAYAAPEQLSGAFKRLAQKQGLELAREVSPATDVWPLGLIAYEALTGALPGQLWGVESAADLPLRILEEPPLASEQAGPRAGLLPGGFDAWMMRCLERDARRRWPSAREACEALLALLSTTSSLDPSAPPSAAVTPAGRATPAPVSGPQTRLAVQTFEGPVSSGANQPAPASQAPLPDRARTALGDAVQTHAPTASAARSAAPTAAPPDEGSAAESHAASNRKRQVIGGVVVVGLALAALGLWPRGAQTRDLAASAATGAPSAATEAPPPSAQSSAARLPESTASAPTASAPELAPSAPVHSAAVASSRGAAQSAPGAAAMAGARVGSGDMATEPKEQPDRTDTEMKQRRVLESRMASGKATRNDLRTLKAICMHQGDAACSGRAQAALTKLSESENNPKAAAGL